jgi:hypothetical protein
MYFPGFLGPLPPTGARAWARRALGPCGRIISQVTRSNLKVTKTHCVSDSQAAVGLARQRLPHNLWGYRGACDGVSGI